MFIIRKYPYRLNDCSPHTHTSTYTVRRKSGERENWLASGAHIASCSTCIHCSHVHSFVHKAGAILFFLVFFLPPPSLSFFNMLQLLDAGCFLLHGFVSIPVVSCVCALFSIFLDFISTFTIVHSECSDSKRYQTVFLSFLYL